MPENPDYEPIDGTLPRSWGKWWPWCGGIQPWNSWCLIRRWGRWPWREESGADSPLPPREGIPGLVSRETPLLSKGRDEILAYLRGAALL